jgi:3-oxoacyl-[acyl-carrier protein] reductase
MATAAQPQKRLVLITGATGGIGKATAITFAKTGLYDLALHYNSASLEIRDQLARDIQSASFEGSKTEISFFQADLDRYEHVRKLHGDVVQTMGEVDVLFNNAGTVAGQTSVKSLADVPIDIFEASWRTNTGSPILLTQLCLPHMESHGWGRVIFNSSVAAFTGGLTTPY